MRKTESSRQPTRVVTVRLTLPALDALNGMKTEHPIYTHSLLIRAALKLLGVYSPEERRAVVMATEDSERQALRRDDFSEKGATRGSE